jgi:hypothetical protein
MAATIKIKPKASNFAVARLPKTRENGKQTGMENSLFPVQAAV